MDKKIHSLLTVLFGIFASVLAVLAIAVYEGYIPGTWAWNQTADELGVEAALLVVVSAAFYYTSP